MVYPPVRGDNPRALASGLSYEQVDGYCITFYSTLNSADLRHNEIFLAKIGKGGTGQFSSSQVIIMLVLF